MSAPHIQPVDFPLDVLYEDDDLLLLDKPAGIALHPAALTEEPVTLAGADWGETGRWDMTLSLAQQRLFG